MQDIMISLWSITISIISSIVLFQFRNSDDPLLVSCGMRLLNINEIDPVKFSFSVNVAYKFYWVDNRVQVNDSTLNKTHVLDQDIISKIWMPKYYTFDLQKFRFLGPGREGLRVIKNQEDTEIQYEFEANVVFKCPINYSDFPFHSARCKLKLTSPSLKNTSILFRHKQWPQDRVVDSFIEIQGYDFKVSHLTGEDTVAKSWNNKGWYSVVGLQIDLYSRHTKYIYLYFLPTTMLTMTSWVSHLLPPTSYPARISLGVILLLCQVSIFTSSIRDTPNHDKGCSQVHMYSQ